MSCLKKRRVIEIEFNIQNYFPPLEIIHNNVPHNHVHARHRNRVQLHTLLSPCPPTDVALSSGLLCHDPNSPTRGCCSDDSVLLGGFGGPYNPNLTVSSVEYLGPEEEPPPSGTGQTDPPRPQSQLINGRHRAAKANSTY